MNKNYKMKSNLQEKLPLQNDGQIFTFVGMSGCGKTTLSQKLASEGFFHYSVDYEIAHTYLREKIRKSVIEKITNQSPYFKNLYEKFAVKLELSLTFDDLEVITMFVIPTNESGKIPLGNFLEHQNIYKQAELLATKECFSKAKIAFENYGISGFINDSTGSICEVALENNELIELLKTQTKVVYLQTNEGHKETLISRSKEKVKPILYNYKFLMESLEIYYKKKEFSDDFEIDQEFFFWIFPRLLELRKQNYEELVQKTNGTTIDASAFWNIKNAQDFTNLIHAK